MIQLVAVAAVGGLVWYGLSQYRRHSEALEKREKEKAAERLDGSELEQDPVTGKWRPRS